MLDFNGGVTRELHALAKQGNGQSAHRSQLGWSLPCYHCVFRSTCRLLSLFKAGPHVLWTNQRCVAHLQLWSLRFVAFIPHRVWELSSSFLTPSPHMACKLLLSSTALVSRWPAASQCGPSFGGSIASAPPSFGDVLQRHLLLPRHINQKLNQK